MTKKMSSFKNIILLKDKSTLSSVMNKSYNEILDDGKSIDERSQRLAEMKTEADSSILQDALVHKKTSRINERLAFQTGT